MSHLVIVSSKFRIVEPDEASYRTNDIVAAASSFLWQRPVATAAIRAYNLIGLAIFIRWDLIYCQTGAQLRHFSDQASGH